MHGAVWSADFVSYKCKVQSDKLVESVRQLVAARKAAWCRKKKSLEDHARG